MNNYMIINYSLKSFLVMLLAYLISIIPCYFFMAAPLILYVGTKVVRDVVILLILLNKKNNNFNEHFKLNTIIIAISGIIYIILGITQYRHALYFLLSYYFLQDNILYQLGVELMFDDYFYAFYLVVLVLGLIFANWSKIKEFGVNRKNRIEEVKN